MKNRSKKSSVSSGILLSVVGGIFTAVGIALLVITIKGLIESGISEIGGGIVMPIVLMLAFRIRDNRAHNGRKADFLTDKAKHNVPSR